VTLVGPGGVGKTRLAQEAADGHDPVWWVDLAPLRDHGAVGYAVADAAGVEVVAGTPLQEALARWAGRAGGLLVLDNCEHLLAAARIGTLTVDDLAGRLDARFDLLRSGRRDGDARHQTLWAVVDWSFELLGADEQRLFLRLSVSAAGFDIAAAEMVAAGADLPADRVADLVARLAERSMLTRPGASGVGRYRMLETLRAYAASRLPAGEADRFRRRHAGFMVDLAERAEAGLYGPDEAAWARRVERWLDDLRAAWGWARDAGELGLAARLAAALTRFAYWRLHGDLLAWGTWVAATVPAHPRLAIATANQALTLAYAADDQAARPAAEAALAAAHASANPTAIAMARFAEGEAFADTDPARAAAALDEAVWRGGEVGNRFVAGTALTALVALRGRHGPPEEALALFRDAIDHWRASRNRTLLVTTLRNLVVLLARTGRDEPAAALAASVREGAPSPSYGAEAARIATAAARTLEAAADDAIRLLAPGPGGRAGR
jgi:predicted ATPase